jgi:hypothetical protein
MPCPLLLPQIASIVCTVAIAILAGSIAGWIVSAVNPAGHRLSAMQLFDDGAYWQVRRVAMVYMPAALPAALLSGAISVCDGGPELRTALL